MLKNRMNTLKTILTNLGKSNWKIKKSKENNSKLRSKNRFKSFNQKLCKPKVGI